MILGYDEHKIISSLKKTKSLDEFENLLLSMQNDGTLNEIKAQKINYIIKALRTLFKKKQKTK